MHAASFNLSHGRPSGVFDRDRYRGTGLDQLLVGSADTVVRELRRYRNMGFDYVMVRPIVGDHHLMLRSFERIGRDVMPRIRGF
jgi:alkanesulfonate monooxygenase SsuD/methylene tetrahydromethanopterin reductase-like flavin-dependent oxidoreductase (luciferase family)